MGDCATVSLDALFGGLGGRDGTFTWAVYPELPNLGTKTAKLDGKLLVFSVGSQSSIRFASSLLSNNVVYQFGVRVTNYLNATSSIAYATVRVTVPSSSPTCNRFEGDR